MSDSVWSHRWQTTRLPCPWDSPSKNTGVDCHFLLQCVKVKRENEVAQSYLTISDPMDHLPCFSIHGIFQARVLEWGATVHNTSQNRLFGFLLSFISLLDVDLYIKAVTQYAAFCDFTQQNIFEILKSCFPVAKFCLTLHDPMDCRAPGLLVPHYLLEFAQLHVHWIREAIQPSYPLLPSSPSALNFSPASGAFPMSQMAQILELQHESFQWVSSADFFSDFLVWSLCCSRDSQESSSAPQFESINSLVLSIL